MITSLTFNQISKKTHPCLDIFPGTPCIHKNIIHKFTYIHARKNIKSITDELHVALKTVAGNKGTRYSNIAHFSFVRRSKSDLDVRRR